MASTLPPELLNKVLENISHSENAKPTILSCLQVNRKWRDNALPFLYKDLVLFCGPQLDLFTACHSRWAVSSLTRSLTLYISRPGNLPEDIFHETQIQALRLAKDAIPRMENLRSFSIARHHRVPYLDIAKSTVSVILNNLPTSCVGLELALGTSDRYDGDGIECDPTHLCEDVRRLLPRMQHVHMDLGSLCDAMLGTWDPDEKFHPISLPNLRSLHIPCVNTENKRPCLGRHQQEQPSIWKSIIPALQHVVDLPSTADAEVTVLGYVGRLGGFSQDIYRTPLRCHIRKGRTTTWAFPVTNLQIQKEGYKLLFNYLRMKYETYVATRKAIYILAGGRPWRTMKTGSRMPAAWSNSSEWISDGKLGIWTWEEWTKRYPDEMPMLWENEKLTGMRLIGAEEREGYEEISLVEKTPAGFVRRNGRQLFRAGE